MRFRSRCAQTNSAASMARPDRMISQPGPGVTSMTMPTASNVKPPRILKKRLTCWTDCNDTTHPLLHSAPSAGNQSLRSSFRLGAAALSLQTHSFDAIRANNGAEQPLTSTQSCRIISCGVEEYPHTGRPSPELLLSLSHSSDLWRREVEALRLEILERRCLKPTARDRMAGGFFVSGPTRTWHPPPKAS
jgi:hypothetical protein